MTILRRFIVCCLLILPAWVQAYDKDVVEQMLLAQEEVAGLQRHDADVDGHRMFYLDNGRDKSAQAVMFVHGFGDSSLSWTFFARMFRGADYRIIIPDLLGFGRSDRPADADYGYAAQARRLAALLKTLGVTRVHLVGNSMGGGVAAELALQQPQLVASLTLMDAAGVHYKSTELDRQLLQGNNFLVPGKPEDFDRLIDFATAIKPLMPRPVIDYLADRAVHDSALHARIFQDVLFPDVDFLALDLDRIKAPTLIVWGGKDRVLSPENAKVFKKYIPDSRVLIFPEAGHLPMIEIPEESGAAVLKFIDGVAGRSAS
jgi:pimeloyl-ACP methyl ester carboxylesterase